MDEQQPGQESARPTSASISRPAASSAPDRGADQALAIVGGLLAGLGLSIGFAFLMHVVQEVSPNGYAFNIDGEVWLEILIAGPIFGLGVALAITSLIPPAGNVNPSVIAGGPPAQPGPLKHGEPG